MEAGGEGRREASAPKQEGGIVAMASVLLTTSRLDGVLRPARLQKKYIMCLSNVHLPSLSYVSNDFATRCMHNVLTFDSADQKTALVRQVVDHLEKTKMRREFTRLATCINRGFFGVLKVTDTKDRLFRDKAGVAISRACVCVTLQTELLFLLTQLVSFSVQK